MKSPSNFASGFSFLIKFFVLSAIIVTGFLFASVSKADAATLYFNAAVNNDWNTLGNWWDDAGFTDPAAALPTVADDVIIEANVTSNSGAAASVNTLVFNTATNETFQINLTVANGATFNGDSYYYGSTLTGDVTFNDTSYAEEATITGDATFHGDDSGEVGSTINGTRIRLYTEDTTTVLNFTGDPWTVVADGAGVVVDVTGATFNGTTTFQTLNGGSFVGAPQTLYWYNDGVDANWATLADNWWTDEAHTLQAAGLPAGGDNVITLGAVGPTADLDTWTEPGSIDATDTGITFTSVSGEVLDNDVVVTGDVNFTGNASLNTDITSNVTFNDTSSCGGEVELTITGNMTFNDDSYNGICVMTGTATFNDDSYNSYNSISNGTFNDSSYNDGVISGNATFNDSSYNNNEVGGNAIFNDSSYNSLTATVGGNGTFNGDASGNLGTISGTQTRYYSVQTYAERDFVTTGPWTVVADGVDVHIVDAVYDETTTLTEINGGNFITSSTLFLLTSEAEDVGLTGAELGAEIIDDGGEDSTEHGFIYGTDPDLEDDTTTTTLGEFEETGSFSESIEGLTYNTTYYFRAYATTPEGTAYGNILSFTTLNYTLFWYNDGEDTEWTTLEDNWWTDAAHTLQAGALPGEEDIVLTVGAVGPNVDLDTWNRPSSINAEATGITFTSDGGETLDAVTTGDAIFNGSSGNSNTNTITGDVTFNDSSFNSSGGTIDGNAIFNDESYNIGTVTGNATFNDESYHASDDTVEGDAIFNDDSYNDGTVEGNATFNDNSYNTGFVEGNATFTSASDGTLTLSGEQTWGSVEGDVLDGDDEIITEFIFNDESYNESVLEGNATFNDSSHNDEDVTGDATFNDESTNPGTVSGNATFNDSSTNNSNETVEGDAVFNDTSHNQGTVQGNAIFNDESYNAVNVSGNATFNDQSYNAEDAVVQSNAFFNGTSTNFGTVEGDACFAEGATNEGIVEGETSVCLAPTVTTAAATSITQTSATFNGEITDNNDQDSTSRGFNYGFNTNYGSTVTQSDGPYEAETFSSVVGLACGQIYHYRAFATNPVDTSYGSDQTFTTSACSNAGGGGGGGGTFVPPVTPNPTIPPIQPDVVVCKPGQLFSTENGKPCTSFKEQPKEEKCLITVTLRLGSRGEQVKCLQKGLGLVADGVFGRQTRAAVMVFQRSKGLTPDGVVGPRTRSLLLNL